MLRIFLSFTTWTMRKKHNLLFILIIFSFNSFSQEKDFQNWNNFELNFSHKKNIDFSIDNGLRTTENFNTIIKYFSDISLNLKHSDVLNYSFGYRHIWKDTDDRIERMNRLYCSIYFKNKISKKIKYNIRHLIQTQQESEFGWSKNVESKLRQRIKFIYDLDVYNLDLFISVENFYVIKTGFEKLRYQIGCSKPILKNTKININYMIQKEFENNSEIILALRTKITYEF